MREPFSAVLPRGERLVAAGEAELGETTGPLARLGELLAFVSPVVSIVLLVRLDGALAKTAGVIAPPVVLILLAWFPLRRWHRPRQWLGATDTRLLIWRRKAALRAEPRIEPVSLAGVVGVELIQDDWDQRAGVHQFILHRDETSKTIARIHNAKPVRDAVIAAIRGSTPPAPAQPAVPPGDYRP
jgi:hypothetical protein